MVIIYRPPYEIMWNWETDEVEDYQEWAEREIRHKYPGATVLVLPDMGSCRAYTNNRKLAHDVDVFCGDLYGRFGVD